MPGGKGLMLASAPPTLAPSISGNPRLRAPQREAYDAVARWAAGRGEGPDAEREIGLVLPVGCGKSGLITMLPFAVGARRTLVVAPNVKIAEQLLADFDPSSAACFYRKCGVLPGPYYPEPAEIRGVDTNRSDLDEADVVVTNIQQLQGADNRWLAGLPADFFDLVLFDEGHHNVAVSWELVRTRFPAAVVVNLSATPRRADGQLMAGRIVYAYPVFRAIAEGYVKRLKALVLNPRTLRFVRREDDVEVEVSLEEVRRLGEEDAEFRRSIVTSKETLATIVDASLRELDRLRGATGEPRLKIIASALNYEHCIQVVRAYRERGRRADFVHSRADGEVNRRVLRRLESHELDVIVQVRKLGEGFDHPFLAVAAVFSVFSELSPFVQFVGRIMRVIEQNAPASPVNHGTVVFHAGANVARRWADFQSYSEADQAFFDRLLPLEDLEFGDAEELLREPAGDEPRERREPDIEVRGQGAVTVHEVPLLLEDEEARRAFELLRARGITPDDYARAFEHEPIPTTRQQRRRAARRALNERIVNEVGRVLAERHLNPEGHDMDRARLDRTNFQVLKAAVDRQVNAVVERSSGERSELSREDLALVEAHFEDIVQRAVSEVIDGKA